MAHSREGISCSGRLMRSKKRDTGRNASLTDTSSEVGSSSCCRTGSGVRVANWSEGKMRTGRRLVVARAAPVTMLRDPGPIDAVVIQVWRRFVVLAKAAAAWTAPCSLRGMM